MKRLLLVRHAPTPATRAFAFPTDEPLDERGRAEAARLSVPRGYDVVSSPALRCVQTAAAASLTIDRVESAIAECDFGSWAGLSASVIADADIAAWITDPGAAPHGGECLRDFAARVAAWLDGEATRDGGVAAITHGGVVKAAVVHALAAPLEAFWRIDVAPLSITELHARNGRWTVARVNATASDGRPAGAHADPRAVTTSATAGRAAESRTTPIAASAAAERTAGAVAP